MPLPQGCGGCPLRSWASSMTADFKRHGSHCMSLRHPTGDADHLSPGPDPCVQWSWAVPPPPWEMKLGGLSLRSLPVLPGILGPGMALCMVGACAPPCHHEAVWRAPGCIWLSGRPAARQSGTWWTPWSVLRQAHPTLWSLVKHVTLNLTLVGVGDPQCGWEWMS